MSMIQIRNVPEALHRRLKARAALSGLSLSDMLLREIAAVAERPSPEELRARLSGRSDTPDIDVVASVRTEREAC